MKKTGVMLAFAAGLAVGTHAATNAAVMRDAGDSAFNGLALKTAVLRLERTKADADRAECRRIAERFFADATATNLALRTEAADARLLAWFLGVDACACSKEVGTNLNARAKRAIDAVVPVVWPSAIDAVSAPTALFACRAIWSSTDALWWTDCFSRYNNLREDPFEGAGTNRLDICARGGFAPDAKPAPETLLAVQIALHELCQRDRDGFAMRKFRDGLDRNAAAVRALAKTDERAAEFLKATAELQVRTNELTTAWGRKVTPENAWREYPRPQMVRRGEWKSLNGRWNFEHRRSGKPGEKEKVLVPFPVESPLSGIHRRVEPTDELVYRRTFDVKRPPANKRRAVERTLLNFEAVDFRAQVFVNGVEATDVPHEGGSVPFSLDVTDLVKDGANELEVRVWDPTDTFINSTGKQTLQMHTCFFPASSGIIGSVWTEQVPRTYLADYGVTADPDSGRVVVTPQVAGDCAGADVTVEALWQGQVVAKAKKDRALPKIFLDLPKPLHLWSGDDPALYDLRITVAAEDDTDVVEGYFGVRRLAIARDAKGVAKLALNGKPVYLLGVLDQGYWPDGYLTPPSEDACRWDVDYLKDIGVNCIRKHIKVEPRCFYAHCDRKGVLVLQDMPSAWHDGIQHDRDRANTRYGFARRELKEIVDHLGNHPSVVCWIPYNESWSQPDEEKSLAVGRWLKRYDPTRLVDLASGWSHFEDGWATAWMFDKARVRPTSEFVTDVIDWHAYPGPKIASANPDRPVICGEFSLMAGGAIEGHFSDVRGRAARYVPDTPEGLAGVREKNHKAYRDQTDRVLKQVREGSSGSILTESFDCFWEACGYVTFDRAVERFDRAFLRNCHREIIDAYRKNWETEKPVRVIFDTDMLTDFDDVGALACLHALADRGECEILATVSSTRGNASVGAIEVINHFYGRGDLPVGAPKGMGVMGAWAGATNKVDVASPLGEKTGNDGGHYKYRKLCADYPQWVRHLDADTAPDANEIYRKALAAAPDHSVVVCTVGFLTNVRRLLETKPDAVSPLDGRALVARKVKKWVAMACWYPRGREYNSMFDAESSKIAFEQWPTPIVFSDWQCGGDLFAGRAVADMVGPRNPVKDVFAGNIPSRAEIEKDPARWQRECYGMGGRSAWDETAVLAAVRGEARYFNVYRGRYRMIGNNGENEWAPDEENGPHARLGEKVHKREVGAVIDELICESVGKRVGPRIASSALSLWGADEL